VFRVENGAPAIIGVVSWSTGPETRGLRRPDRRDTVNALSRLDHTVRKNTWEPNLNLPLRA
jgi:hypothetical protein